MHPNDNQDTGGIFKPLVMALTLGLLVFATLISTGRNYGITWDEPVYYESADQIRIWFGRVFAGDWEAFGDRQIRNYWVFAQPENRNLPFPVIVSAMGAAISDGMLSPFLTHRVGHMLFGSVAAALLFWMLFPRLGLVLSLVACLSVVAMPRFFAHCHLAATDAMTSWLFVLSIASWQRAGAQARYRVFTACLVGLALATKATSVLLIPLLVGWELSFRRKCWSGLIYLLVLTPLVVFALSPMWWYSPFARILGYGETLADSSKVWTIATYYLGKSYIFGQESLPRSSALVMSAITTPPWTLLLALFGLIAIIRRRSSEGALWVMGALALPVLRVVHDSPGHDGVRLLLPSIVCLGPVAAAGFGSLTGGWPGTALPKPRAQLVSLILLGGLHAQAIYRMHPHEMSYYSEAVGGLKFAERYGFEVTYWFEGFSEKNAEAIQRRVPPRARVWIFPEYEGIDLLREWGVWRSDLRDGDIGDADFLLLFTRKSHFYSIPGIVQQYNRRPVWSETRSGVRLIGLYRIQP